MPTKNLGQVAGVAIQNAPPSNIALIWYDSTPSQMCHKVYDTAKQQWVIIDQKIISLITYSEIENLARQSGLPLGKFYQITDKNNTLAVAITSTKVQYADSLGNILIDDLGTNIQYHVSSSNLQIDDISGTFNSQNSKLIFRFEEMDNDIDNDYILGKTRRNNVWTLFKFRLKSLISPETGNSISWNKGLFLNIQNIISGLKDRIGGFVSFETFTKTVETQNTAINNVGKENQQIIQNAQNALTEATKPDSFYATQLPTELETGGAPVDMAKGNTLLQCLSKVQRYINQFKYATGIRLSRDFSASKVTGDVNNNDTVETAIAKLSRVSHSAGVLENYNNTTKGSVQTGDTVEEAFSKVENQVKDVETDLEKKLNDSVAQINKNIDSVEDNLDNALYSGVYPIQSVEFDSLRNLILTINNTYLKYIEVGDVVRLIMTATVNDASSGSFITQTECSFYIDSLSGEKYTRMVSIISMDSSNTVKTCLYTATFTVEDGRIKLDFRYPVTGNFEEPDVSNCHFILFKKSKQVV